MEVEVLSISSVSSALAFPLSVFFLSAFEVDDSVLEVEELAFLDEAANIEAIFGAGFVLLDPSVFPRT